MPEEVMLCENGAITEPAYGMPVMERRFFPIGWSRGNNFAFLSYFEDHDASGLVSLHLCIVDAANDSMMLAEAPPATYDIGTTSQEIWHENIDFFSGLLEQHEIIQEMTVLCDFPLILEDDTLNAIVGSGWVDAEESEMGWPYIDSLNCSLISQDGTRKTIFEQSGIYTCIGAEICGYIKSPFSDFIVVPMVQLHPGWEGPPCLTSISLIGCDPTRGFIEGSRQNPGLDR